MVKKLTIDEVDDTLNKTHLERVGSYHNVHVPILCRCLNCDRYVSPWLLSIRSGDGGCMFCAQVFRSKAKMLSIKRVDEICAKSKVLRIGSYIKSNVPVEVKCLSCELIFFPRINDLDQGKGCPSCAEYGFNPSKPASFYIVANDQWLKGGITNCPKERLYRHSQQGLTQVLHDVHFKIGHDARAMEDKWRAYIKTFPTEARATKSDIRDGFTETVRNFGIIRQWIDANLIS